MSSSSSNKTEMVAIRLTEAQKETWESRDDAAEQVRDLLDDLGESADESGVGVFVSELASIDPGSRWNAVGQQDARAVRLARDAGLELPRDNVRAIMDLQSAVDASDIPAKGEFEVSSGLVSSFASEWE